MESEVVRVERRGRKRKRKDVLNAGMDGELKKGAVETRSKALVGSYVKKEFEGSGVFLGKVVYYDRGLYRIDYEDGDCEDLESGELRQFLIRDGDFKDGLLFKKKELDELILKKYAKEKDIKMGNAVELTNVVGGVEVSSLSESNICDLHENNGFQVDADVGADADSDSSSDSCEYALDGALSFEEEPSLVPPPELPPSSGNIGVPDECVADLLSVYSFLRSFSIPLFLCPFGLEDFVGSLNCSVQNTLLDAIHVALMRALRRHFETLSSDGSELASKCLRSMDWSLIDYVTWPVFLVQYLMMMGYTDGLEWKGFYIDALQRDYYDLSAGRKLMVLQILCDDALDSAELRAEIDMREESEVGIDSDGVIVVTSEVGPRRVHPRYSKTSACQDQEAMGIVTDRHKTNSSCNSSSLGYKSTVTDADVDQDGNGDECRLCGMDGTLLCCDGCPSAYHSRCIGVSKMFIPEGEWYCPECTINKIGPTITRGTSLRGAQFFGVDPYEQVFLGTCDHLLVIKMSTNSEKSIRYYYQKDIPTVLKALHSSVQHVTMYSGLCKGIIQYWEIPVDVISLTGKLEVGTKLANEMEDGSCPTPSLVLLGKNSHDILELAGSENFASCIAKSSSENMAVSGLRNICEEPGSRKASLDTLIQPDHPGHQQMNNDCTTEQAWPLQITKSCEQIKVETTGSVSQQADPSDLTRLKLTGRSDVIGYATCTSGNSNSSNRGSVNGTCVPANMISQGKVANCSVSGRGYRNVADDCIYLGSSFKAQAYINHYTHGDFAASAAANLAVLSSEENRASDSNALDNYRKVMSANVSLQVKAFSSAAIRFFWPNSEKKLVEVPRERCGWCLSCKAIGQSKRGCLLNAAASNAIKGTMKVLSGIRPVKNGEGSLHGIATYVMFMEESLHGLTVGPFISSTYRKQWCKQAEQALTCSTIKGLLLELEENIRVVAFSGDWVKLVDPWSVESSVTQSNTSAIGSSQKRGPSGRRGRKQSVMPEVTADDEQDTSNGFIWWRGGMLSKLIFQKGIIPRKMAKKSARQGGSRKIPSIYYAEGVEVPKRSRRLVWRAAVEMSKTTSQLAVQIRYLDIHVRWSDLVRPEQSPLDGKGAETEASAFRNAFICDKQILENKIRYAVAFGNQKHLPSRIMKNVIEVEKGEDGAEKYWFLEVRVPLYLIKEYEEKMEKLPSPPAEKPVNVLSKLQRRQLKASRKDIFSYLSRRRDNLDTCRCASCQLDVFLGNAVKCSVCEGFCHVQCTISSTVQMNEEVDFLITCKSCNKTETIMQNEIYNVSPTSPLLLQRQEPQNTLTEFKGEKQNGCNRPLISNGALNRSSERKLTSNGSMLKPKKRSKINSWGLIWKKKNCDDTGIDFRLKNILLKGNPNLSKVECDLCKKPYNSDLMYICCETCKKWYHADAVELEESRILELLGFKCFKCRRIRSPVCPYTDPDRKIALEGKKPSKRASKQEILALDCSPETISEQLVEREPAAVVLPSKKELVCVKGDDPLKFSLARVELVTEQPSEVDFEHNSVSLSGPGPQKLPVRRLLKREDDFTSSSANIPSVDSSTPIVENTLLPTIELSSPCIEWDVSTNDFEDGMMFDYEGLNYEDMEFEPQTYFSFTELLASDDVSQLDGVDPSTNIIENMENSSTLSQNGNLEQNGMSIDQQEHTDPLEPAVHSIPCQICSHTEPSTDFCCQICGFWMHSQCLPWVEESSGQGGWRCGNCHEWLFS